MAVWIFEWLGVLYGALLGSCLASFGCVVSERVPTGRGIGGRSACACGRQLRWWENLPVVGWLASGGRARCCGVRLPVRYLAWEVAFAAWGALVAGWAWHRWVDGTLTATVLALTGAGFAGFFLVLVATTWQAPHRLPPAS